jgi:hypothetical protein
MVYGHRGYTYCYLYILFRGHINDGNRSRGIIVTPSRRARYIRRNRSVGGEATLKGDDIDVHVDVDISMRLLFRKTPTTKRDENYISTICR